MKYRPEIDGLRAIAVISVIFYHAGISFFGFNPFRGGFIGVDIFFVISGFLITSILLREMENGSFTFIGFYERRVRRILPMLGFVTLATIPLSWLLMDQQQLLDFGQSIIAIGGFSSNILFWHESGYFTAPSDFKPLLHTWSLSVEEQFYVLFPIILLICWKFARNRITLLFLIGFLVSLLLSDWGSHKYADAAFFLLPTRSWELLAGALLAKLELKRDRHSRPTLSLLMPIVGLLLVVISIAFFDSDIPHPGFKTLLPIIGVMLLIWFAGKGDPVSIILSSRLLVGVGLISYSLYLWHLPLLSYIRLLNVGKLPDNAVYLILPILFIISYLSWKFIEGPFRNKKRLSRRRVFWSMGIFWAILVIIGLFIHFNKGRVARISIPESVTDSFTYGDETSSPHKCVDVKEAHLDTNLWCSIGDTSNTSDLFFMTGDSHAYAAIPQFEAAARRSGVSGITIALSGCPILTGIEPLRGEGGTRCVEMTNRIYDYVVSNSIKAIFIVNRWTYYTFGYYDGSELQNIKLIDGKPAKTLQERQELLKKGIAKTISRYRNAGVEVHLVSQVPQQKYIPKEFYKSMYTRPEFLRSGMIEKYSVSVADDEKFMNFTNKLLSDFARENDGVYFHDFRDLLCDASNCFIGTEEETFYFDDDHLSITGSLLLEQKTKKIMDEIIDRNR